MENHTDFINNGLSAIGVYRMQFILIRRERCYRFNRRYT